MFKGYFFNLLTDRFQWRGWDLGSDVENDCERVDFIMDAQILNLIRGLKSPLPT